MRNEALVCEDKALSSSSSFLPEAYPTIAYPYGMKVDTSERQESLRLTFLYAVVHIPCDSNRTDNNNLMLTAVSNQQQSIFAITSRINPLTVHIRSESQFERFHRVIPDANHHVIALFPLEGRTEIAPNLEVALSVTFGMENSSMGDINDRLQQYLKYAEVLGRNGD